MSDVDRQRAEIMGRAAEGAAQLARGWVTFWDAVQELRALNRSEKGGWTAPETKDDDG